MNSLLVLGIFVLLQGIVEAKDWESIKSHAQDIRDECKRTAVQIKEIAVADNAAVGKSISDSIDNAQARAKVHAEEIIVGIREQSLTEQKAKEVYNKFQNELTKVRAEVSPQLGKLSKGAETKIRDLFKAEYDTVQSLIDKVIGMLK